MVNTKRWLKVDKDFWGWFVQDKAEDEARLTPYKDDNEVLRKSDQKDSSIFN